MSKAVITDPSGAVEPFEVQFNPNSLEYSAGANSGREKGAKDNEGNQTSNIPTHSQIDPTRMTTQATLSVKLFFHTYTDELTFSDVREQVKKLRVFVRTVGNIESDDVQIRFTWGTWSFTGVVSSFHATYQMFASNGTPVQAEVALSITGEDPEFLHYAETAQNIMSRNNKRAGKNTKPAPKPSEEPPPEDLDQPDNDEDDQPLPALPIDMDWLESDWSENQ